VIDLSLLFLFSFLSLSIFAIGVAARVPFICMGGAGILVLTGFLLGAVGLQEYDGTANSVITYQYLTSANASVANATITRTANYVQVNSTVSNGAALVFVIIGLFGAYYGWLIRPVDVDTRALVEEV
jgi:hypothetical protein